jgi:HlyD family secretion protein
MMDNMQAAHTERVQKKAIRRAILAFVFMMVGLTFFSNTLVNLSLPQVTVEQPFRGSLSHEVTGLGTVESVETSDLYVQVNWAVSEVAVQVGDRVEAGQLLVAFHTQDAENSLKDNEARYRQKQLSLQKLQDSYLNAARSGEESQIATLARDIESAQLDLQILERGIASARRQLDDYSRLMSPVTGMVTEINAVKGAPVPNGKAVARIADLSKGHLLKATVHQRKAQYVNVGDETEIVFETLSYVRVKGIVAEIRDTSDQTTISFRLQDQRLKGGESGEFHVVKTVTTSAYMLSNAAVREDNDGKYVLVMKEKKGPLGTEYVLQRANVQVGDSDDQNTVIVNGVTPMDKVVVSSNKRVAEGERVIQSG